MPLRFVDLVELVAFAGNIAAVEERVMEPLIEALVLLLAGDEVEEVLLGEVLQLTLLFLLAFLAILEVLVSELSESVKVALQFFLDGHGLEV